MKQINDVVKTVSVCMATYNGEKYITSQVESILVQLKEGDELIVSDDGSNDSTISILKSFRDSRVKIFHNSGNKGPVGNFQNALYHASGAYIFLADQDDIWFDTKINTMKTCLDEYDVVVCDCSVVDESLGVVKTSYFEHGRSGSGLLKNFKRNTYMGNCMAFKSSLLPVILPFPISIPNHDLWIGIVAELFYKPYFLRQVLGLHRRHNSNASNTFDVKIPTSFWQKVNKRFLVIQALPRLLYKKMLNRKYP